MQFVDRLSALFLSTLAQGLIDQNHIDRRIETVHPGGQVRKRSFFGPLASSPALRPTLPARNSETARNSRQRKVVRRTRFLSLATIYSSG